MAMFALRWALVIFTSLGSVAVRAQEPIVLPVWPGATVGDSGQIGPERVRAPEEAPTKTARWITNVTKPTITVFRPPKSKNSGVAMIICPGGGYWNLAIDLEGEEVAARFTQAGITGIVLKYRVPRRPGQPEPLPAPGPLLDAQRAVSLVRSKASEWGVEPNKIGICGFSAGAHLALTTATYFDKRAYEPIDEIDRVSCRPDFAALAYPGYLVDIETWELKPWIRIPPGTPPVFLVHAGDDTERGASPAHSAVTYLALKKAGIPAELHIYAKGEHGFGVRNTTIPGANWPDRCLDWLRSLGLFPGSLRSQREP